MSAADEQQLIVQAKNGNARAFRDLVERYMKHAYNVAHSFVGSHDDAEDIAQEAFVRVHRALSSFRGDAEFSTWLYRITMNLSLNRLNEKKKKMQRETNKMEDVQKWAGPGPEFSENADVQMHVERALHRLPTLQRAVVILRHLDGLSTCEVSNILQCSEGTVKTHLYRGLKKMRVMLDFLNEGRT
jgi:RNA polymerase sigma-70 factor (ECF subfamily)